MPGIARAAWEVCGAPGKIAQVVQVFEISMASMALQSRDSGFPPSRERRVAYRSDSHHPPGQSAVTAVRQKQRPLLDRQGADGRTFPCRRVFPIARGRAFVQGVGLGSDYRARVNLIKKVLDFVQFGGVHQTCKWRGKMYSRRETVLPLEGNHRLAGANVQSGCHEAMIRLAFRQLLPGRWVLL